MKPVVVILHYADPEVTRALHRQLLAADKNSAQDILVLDNHSPLPYPGAWRRLERNLYWGGALAYCLDLFQAAGRTHLWFLNNDITFLCRPPILERALQRLRALEKRCGPVGIYSPAVTHNVYHPQMAADATLQFRQVSLIDGIAPLLRLDAVTAAGGLDAADNPIGYGADLWLSHRVRRAGFHLMVDHQVQIRHAFHKAAGDDPRFWQAAHAQEDAFFARTFGERARERIASLQVANKDFADMPHAGDLL